MPPLPDGFSVYLTSKIDGNTYGYCYLCDSWVIPLCHAAAPLGIQRELNQVRQEYLAAQPPFDQGTSNGDGPAEIKS